MTRLGDTDLDVFPLCLGGNVFGWTADRESSFEVLDAYVAAGGNFIDTADVYAGGESEQIIGEWLKRRERRHDVVIATKVGMSDERQGLGAENIKAACEDSLRRLGIEHIDLFYAHRDDPDVPMKESLEAFDDLVREGKARHVAASNYEADRLEQALRTQTEGQLSRFVALQPHLNLVERNQFEGGLEEVCQREGLGCVPYFGLAKGFLTGKYRSSTEAVDSPRAPRAAEYLKRGGEVVLDALDQISEAHENAPLPAVSLAWLRAQPTVVAPIASARDVDQLRGLLPMAELELSEDELSRLDEASRQLR